MRVLLSVVLSFVMFFATTIVAFESPTPSNAPITMAGTLFVPEGWPLHLTLSIHPTNPRGSSVADTQHIPLKRMLPLPGAAGWYRWSSGRLSPRQYTLNIYGTGFFTTVELAPSGNKPVELVLAEPARLVVRVFDEASGKPVGIGSFQWLSLCDSDGSYSLNGSIDIDQDEGATTCSGLVPVGPGELFMHNESWGLATDFPVQRIPQKIHSGSQELVVRVRRACGVIVALVCEGESVAWDQDAGFKCKIDAVDHPGNWITKSICEAAGNAPKFQVTSPGRYRVKLPPIPGYAPHDPVEFEIPAGTYITHTVELRRE